MLRHQTRHAFLWFFTPRKVPKVKQMKAFQKEMLKQPFSQDSLVEKKTDSFSSLVFFAAYCFWLKSVAFHNHKKAKL